MSEELLLQQVENYLGTRVGASEWIRAKSLAERKLAAIISREGDGGGARKETRYIVQLIAETVEDNRFAQYTLRTAFAKDATKIGSKKGQPVL